MRFFGKKQDKPQTSASSDRARSNMASIPAVPAHALFHLQRAAGNYAVQQMLQSSPEGSDVSLTTAPEVIQAKLAINKPGDKYEQEADRIAHQVTASPVHSKTESAPPHIQRFASSSTAQPATAPASVDRALGSPGSPLEPSLRQDMEQRFGEDFSQVRVHMDATAEESAQAIKANAYTAGRDLVFGKGQFMPTTSRGKQLIAHELTHVVQQSRSPLPITTAARPGLVQRQPRDAKQAARAKVEEAMQKLKARFGLGSITEENGATWSESELAKVNAAFSKVSKEDQPLLKGLHLVRTDKFEPFVKKGKTFKIAGTTYGTNTIRLAKEAFQGNASTILHEVGHLIQNKVAAAMLGKSKSKFNLDVASMMMEESRKKVPTRVGREVEAFSKALYQMTEAANDLMNSGEADRAAKKSVLDESKVQADITRGPVERLKGDDVARAWLEFHDRQQKWVEAVEQYMEEKRKKNLTGFIDVVTKNNLARKGYVPFTDYVAARWPAEPEEFFAQSFHTWRTNPSYMKTHMKPLFDWFEKGGHREGKGYLEGKSFLEVVREQGPVFYELGREAKETFGPVINGVLDQSDLLQRSRDRLLQSIFGNQ